MRRVESRLLYLLIAAVLSLVTFPFAMTFIAFRGCDVERIRVLQIINKVGLVFLDRGALVH
jgi:hypothetical protein